MSERGTTQHITAQITTLLQDTNRIMRYMILTMRDTILVAHDATCIAHEALKTVRIVA